MAFTERQPMLGHVDGGAGATFSTFHCMPRLK